MCIRDRIRAATRGGAAATTAGAGTRGEPGGRGGAAGARGGEGSRGEREARARQARGGSRLRTVVRRAAKTLVALVLVGAVVFGAWWGARQVWFLSTDPGGRVALYQGLPYELPFGIELYSQSYSIPIQTDSLPAGRRESVTEHTMRSRDDAVSLIEDLEATTTPTALS